jgi:hypothetical protein
MKYNKEFVKKDGRKLVSGGPRDLQRRQKEEATFVRALQEEIHELREELKNRPKTTEGMYTAEQLNNDIIEEVNKAVADIKKTHSAEIAELKELIRQKDAQIEELKNKRSSETENKLTALLSEATEKIEKMAAAVQAGENASTESDRPQMETVFIDPAENESEDVESYLETKDFSASEKEEMESKVNKLKNLMGKSPLRRG